MTVRERRGAPDVLIGGKCDEPLKDEKGSAAKAPWPTCFGKMEDRKDEIVLTFLLFFLSLRHRRRKKSLQHIHRIQDIFFWRGLVLQRKYPILIFDFFSLKTEKVANGTVFCLNLIKHRTTGICQLQYESKHYLILHE